RRDLAEVDILSGDLEAVRATLLSSLEEIEALSLPGHAMRAATLLCAIGLFQDDLPTASTWADRSLDLAQQASEKSRPFLPVALLAARTGLVPEGAHLLGASDAWLASFGGRRMHVDAELERRVVAVLESSCGKQEAGRLR